MTTILAGRYLDADLQIANEAKRADQHIETKQ